MVSLILYLCSQQISNNLKLSNMKNTEIKLLDIHQVIELATTYNLNRFKFLPALL